MKFEVDKETCIACGLCASIAPSVFVLTDDGYAQAINGADPDDLGVEAMENCPVDAISED